VAYPVLVHPAFLEGNRVNLAVGNRAIVKAVAQAHPVPAVAVIPPAMISFPAVDLAVKAATTSQAENLVPLEKQRVKQRAKQPVNRVVNQTQRVDPQAAKANNPGRTLPGPATENQTAKVVMAGK
jgi:hypothetical protein